MSNYRRKSKPKSDHIKKGFTVFQKTIATIASILGLITASITIMNAFDKNKKETPSQTTTIIREVQKEAPTESNSPTQGQSNNQETSQKEEVQTPSKKQDTKSDNNSQKNEQSDSSSNTPTTEAGVSANNGAS